MSAVLSISAIGGSGPKATAVNFVKNNEGQRPWAWISNEIAANLVPGMTLTVDHVSASKVQTHYEDAHGTLVPLAVPKIQLFLGGSIVADAPESEPIPEVTFSATDAAAKYAEAYRAKQAKSAVRSDREVISLAD